MRLVGCVNAYQDAPMLIDCLHALRPQVDRLVVVDGSYRDFPAYGPTAASTDGTLDLSRAVADLVIEAPGGQPWLDEIVKRNAYLRACCEGDYLFVVDADEVLEGRIDRAALGSRDDWMVELYLLRTVGDVPGEPPPRDGNPYGIHRAFRWRPGIRYAGTHHAVHVGDRLIHPQRDLQQDWLPGVKLRHLSARRDQDRMRRKHSYYERLAPAEREYRAAYHL